MAGLSQASANSSSVRGWNWNMLEPRSTTKSTIWWFKTPQNLGFVCFLGGGPCTMINHIYLGGGFNFFLDSWGNDPIRLARIFQKGWFIQQLVGFGDSRPLNCSSLSLFVRVLKKRKASKYPNNYRRGMWLIVRRPFLTWPFWWSFDEGD